mgnify:CR=1 FL=1
MPKTSAFILTEKAVRAARAGPGQRLELWDARAVGLCLRVSEKGKIWVVRYRTIDGRQPRQTLGPAGDGPGDISLAEARDRASELRRLAREGDDPAARKRRAAVKARTEALRTVGDLAESFFSKTASGEYRATRSGKKPETLAGERRLWAFRLKDKLSKQPLDHVTRGDIQAVLTEIAHEAPIQSNRARALLRSMFNFAIREDRLGSNPVAGIMALGDEIPRDRVLTDREIRTVWRALDDSAGLIVREGAKTKPLYISPAVRIALKLALLTLQRRSEISGMRVDELRLEEGTWTISRERTKNGRAHLVPLSPLALELVRTALSLRENQASAFVFPSPWKRLRHKPIENGAMSHVLSDIYNATGICDANLHDLRRTGASNMASERLLVPPIVISRVLNHTLDAGGGAAVTMRHYALHEYAREKRAALNGWAALLWSITSGGEQADRRAGQ